MTIEANKNLVNDCMTKLDQRDLDGVLGYFAPDALFHGWAPQTIGLDGYTENMSALLAAFPDSRFGIDDIIAEGNRVVARHHLKGTHNGDFNGIPATGRSVTVAATATFRIEDGKVRESWLNADFLGLLQQLGAIPEAA